MKPQILRLAILLLLTSWFGCATTEEGAIGFEPVNHISNNLDCRVIFSDSRKSIIELNDVLIQIGITLDPFESNVAIIHINGQEQVLKLIKSDHVDKHVKESYANEDYKIELNYDLKYASEGVNAKEPYFEGDCQLWHNSKRSKMKVYGLNNML